MVRCLLVFIASIFICQSDAVRAQEYPAQSATRVDKRTLVRSVQCEVGLFARAVRNQHVPAKRMFASAKITDKIESGWGFGGNMTAAIIAKFSAQATNGNTYQNTLNFKKFVLSEKNVAACHDRNTLALYDLRQCLNENAPYYGSGGPLGAGDADCLSQVNVKLEATAGVQFPISIVTVGPSASWSTNYVHGVQVTAPAGNAGAGAGGAMAQQ